MLKTAVFGAAGWVGQAILENLAGRHLVRAFDRGPEAWQTVCSISVSTFPPALR